MLAMPKKLCNVFLVRKLFTLAFLLLFFNLYCFSQQQQQVIIKGIISSDKDDALEGVTVTIKGTSTGTTSDSKGKYAIGVRKGATLVYTFVGYQEKEVKVINESSGAFVFLISKAKDLDSVVVVGYGTTRKSDLTGSVGTISKDKLEKVPTATFDLKIQGRVSGVQVTSTSAEPGGNVSIRIRGSNSISGDNEPLYVIDGYPLPSGGEAAGSGLGQPQNALSGINPNDIESIQVLKDASSTAIYGSRGANGVVIITTKRGVARPAKVEFNSRVGTTQALNVFALMTARDFAQVNNDFAISQGQAAPFNGSSKRFPTPDQAGIGTNWVNEILQTGVSQNHQINISGGTEIARYNISGNYFQETGIVRNSNFIRGSLRANFDNKISDKIALTTTLNLSNSNSQRVQSGTGALLSLADPINLALRSNPIFPKDATAIGDFGNAVNSETGIFNNPVTLINDKRDEVKNQDYFASILGVYKITKQLSLNIRGGNTIRNSMRQIYFPKTTGQGFLTNGDAYSNQYSFKDYLFESFLKYQKQINKNNRIDLTGGFSYQSNTTQTTNVRVTTFPNDLRGFDALQFGTGYYVTPTQKVSRTLSSFYVRGNYSLLDRYLFTFTGRADGSSVFAENNKWAFFPTGAFAWKLSKEPFYPKKAFVNDVKLRASYGIVGSQAIPPLGSLARLGVANYNINDAIVSGVAPVNLSNPNLKWETTRALDFGGDFAFLNGRLNLVVDIYKKTTFDLLQQVQLPISSGFSSAINNVGSIENKGLEIDLSGKLVDKKDFNWSMGFNISFNRSKVLDLGVVKEIVSPGTATSFLSSTSAMRVDQPYGTFFGLKALRLIQPSDLSATNTPNFATFNGEKRPGQWLYEDLDGNNIINNADRQIIGDPNPNFIFGFTNDFKYKNITLSVFFQGVSGNEVMNVMNAFIGTGYANNNKTQDWFLNRWTPTNPTNDIRYPAFGTIQSSLQSGNYYIQNASFIRLKNVTFTYNIPKITKSVTSASVFISGTNLLTFTKYKGFDPEVGVYGQTNQLPGIDFGSYPRSRVIDLGFKVIF